MQIYTVFLLLFILASNSVLGNCLFSPGTACIQSWEKQIFLSLYHTHFVLLKIKNLAVHWDDVLVCLQKKNAACASCLYDNNILTTVAVWSTLPPLQFTYGLLFIWHWDIKARRMWVQYMIHRRKKHGEYYHLGQEQGTEPHWRHQVLSEKLTNFQLEALREGHYGLCLFLCCCRQSLRAIEKKTLAP